jgi:hypothetical protein
MKRVMLICLWIVSAALVCTAQSTFYFPHIANGEVGLTRWRTTILLTNAASSGTASGTITFTKDDQFNLSAAGTVFNTIAFTDQAGASAGSGGVITFSIPAGQTRKYTSTGAGAYSGGFATVVTTAGNVTGTSIFSQFTLSDRLHAEAGVPSATATPNQAIFVDTQGAFNVGFAYSNVGTAAANVTLSLLNSAAVSVTSTTQTLGPGNHNAKFLSEVFPNIPALAGRLEIRSSAPVSAVALRFDRDSGVFTTLPPITLASLIAPAVQWFEQRPWLSPLTSVARLLGAFQVSFS